MNSQIETWRVQQFAASVYHTSQQKGSRLASLARQESFVGKSEHFDILGATQSVKKTSRNSPTPNIDIAHDRRMLTVQKYEWGTVVDSWDKLQNIHQPENEYMVAARNALGRDMDDVVIEALLGYAYSGEAGTTSNFLPNAQKITAVKSSAIDYANVQLLRKAKAKFDKAEVEGPRYIIHNADFLEALLATTEVASFDFNTVKALVQGEVDTFMGFKFIHSERLPLASVHDVDTTSSADGYNFNAATGLFDDSGTDMAGTESCAIAVVGTGMIFGKNEGMVARVSERNDLSHNPQVYCSMNFGGLRMEDKKVVQLIYKT